MSRFSTYFLSWVLSFFLINVCTVFSTYGQQSAPKFGVSFSSDLSDTEILTLVPTLISKNIEVVELHHPVSDALLTNISAYPIQLLVRSDFNFLTESEILDSDRIRTELAPFVLMYANNPQISGVGLSSYSEPIPISILQNLRNQLSDSVSVNFYQVGTSVNADLTTILLSHVFDATQVSQHYVFEAPFSTSDISILSNALDANAALILMDWFWYTEASTGLTYFDTALSVAAETSDNLFPTPSSNSSSTVPDWPIIILVLLWISLGVHARSNLTYRPLIFRYFTFHRFFVDDIMRYRERSSIPGITLCIQHAFFTGLIVYILGITFISEKGLEAFYFHLPILSLFGKNYFTLFVLSVVVTIVTSLINLMWLYFPSKSMNHFSQTLSLYSWVFHIDFILVSIALILTITQASNTLILIFGAAHFLFWIIGFIVAAFDSSKYLMNGKAKYLLQTIGIFVFIVVGVGLAFLISGYPNDILCLAIAL